MTKTHTPSIPDGATPGGRCPIRRPQGSIRTYLLNGQRYHSNDQTPCDHGPDQLQTGPNAVPGV